MATKAQEREALKKIVTIVEEVGGTDSYLGMTFEGCFGMAAENITNDFADSYKGRWERALKTIEELKLEKAEWSSEETILQTRIEDAEARADKAETNYNNAKDHIHNQNKEIMELRAEMDGAHKAAEDAEARAAQLEAENMKLKAMLFDLMYNK